jgi:hypothetical protein
MSHSIQRRSAVFMMLATHLKTGFLLAAWIVVAIPVRPASPSAAAPQPEPAGTHFTFSFLPKAFQKDPPVHMTVITEMTVDGSKVRTPTAAKPMYYLSHSLGYHDEGDSVGEKKIIPVDRLQAMLQKALAENHFLTADSGHPAALVMIFTWGAANKLDNRTDSFIDVTPPTGPGSAAGPQPDSGTSSYFEEPPDVMSFDYATRQNFLARAQLVGGIKFAHEVGEALKQADFMHDGSSTISGLGPLELLEDREPLVKQLIEQTMDDCYYVVASAYDAYAMAHGQRRLLWQTKMSTNSEGIAMAETLPALIQSGAPYFGHAMAQPTILQGHLEREGHVEVGTPTVMPDQSPAPAAPAAK